MMVTLILVGLLVVGFAFVVVESLRAVAHPESWDRSRLDDADMPTADDDEERSA